MQSNPCRQHSIVLSKTSHGSCVCNYRHNNNNNNSDYCLYCLHSDEAARMWQKREAEWQNEKRARESLMAEVMEERQRQLEERMERLKIQQQETIEEREQLIREIEQANEMTVRENRDKENKQLVRQKELKEQVSSWSTVCGMEEYIMVLMGGAMVFWFVRREYIILFIKLCVSRTSCLCRVRSVCVLFDLC